MALFGGGMPVHVMEDIREAKQLIAELPAHDAAKSLEKLTFWLNSISGTDGFKLDYRYELLDLLDQAAKNPQRKLSQEYLATDRHNKQREYKLWTTVFEFWKMLGGAYLQCVEQYQAGASGASAFRKDLPAAIARALRTMTQQLKWALLRYGPIDDRVWGEIGRLYIFAETNGMASPSIEIYPGVQGRGTVQQEFIKALVLSISSTDGLTPIMQEIAERTVAHFGTLYTLQAMPAPGCNYFFDLSMRKPGARVRKNAQPNKMTRFFGAAKALPALEQLALEIKTNNSVPSHINFGGSFEPELVLQVMGHLALYWSDEPPARGFERRKTATRLTVVHSFNQVLEHISPDAEDNSLDFQAQYRSESWIVENVSDGGFGAIIPEVKGDWITLGSLLGVRTETAKYWGAGVIRRLMCDEFGQRQVGIQVLSSTAIPVALSPAATASSFNAMREGAPAVLLSTSPDKNGEIALLLKAGSFTPGQALVMSVRGKQHELRASKLLEGGEDFDWAKFQVVLPQ